MMKQRLQKICGHVCAAVPVDKAGEGIQEILNQRRAITAQFKKDILELEASGKPPVYTPFDINLATGFQAAVPTRQDVESLLSAAQREDRLEHIAKLLPGPWQDCNGDREKQIDLIIDLAQKSAEGREHTHYTDLMKKYGGRGLSSNIVIPVIVSGGFGKTSHRGLYMRVIMGDPEDCEAIQRKHLRKDDAIQPALMDSLVSVDDLDNWREQRNHFNEAFMPLSSLAKIMPTVLTRARHCAERLEQQSEGGKNQVDISNFLLHEAMAQLHLGLLGSTTEAMEVSNSPVREAFGGRSEGPRAGKPGEIGKAMEFLMQNVRTNPKLSLPSEKNDEEFKGPVSRAIFKAEEHPDIFTNTSNYGNVLLILFAGHDTTGHTMTWLTFELARHPEIMKELQKECDEFFEYLNGRDPTYQDLYRLTFMNKCITEAMRLWPVVPSVGIRTLMFPEFVKGPDGNDVQLPKDTKVNVIHWARHRNPELWGPDVDEFNPYRTFEEREVVSVGGPGSSVNPQSYRFSPFAYGPRSCLGKNFAQLEMRLILVHLYRKFDFTLAGAHERHSTQKSFPNTATVPLSESIGLNRGTMGPTDMEESEQKLWGTRHLTGMKVYARARAPARAPASASSA